MALKQTYVYKSFPLEYWVITEFYWSKNFNQTTVSIAAFKDILAREADVNNFMPESAKTFYYVGRFTTQELYQKIKQEEYFKDAVDC